MTTLSSLHLGDVVLDQDHARFLELVEQLRQVPPEAVVVALDALRAHAGEHFSTEDADLRVMVDGNAKCHLDEHAAVLRSLDEVRDVLLDKEVDESSKGVLVQRLAAQMLSWLPEHVQEMDAGVASHRSKRRFGGAPVQITKRARQS